MFVRCCIYLKTYDWIKSFLKITIEGRAIYGYLENKIKTLYWPVENSIPKNNDADDRQTCSYEMMQTENYRRSVGGA